MLAAVSPAEQNWIHLEIKLFYEMSKKNQNQTKTGLKTFFLLDTLFNVQWQNNNVFVRILQ